MNGQQTFLVEYAVRTGIDGSVVHVGTHTLPADGPDTAGEHAVTWVHETDPYADPRIDPQVQVLSVTEQGAD